MNNKALVIILLAAFACSEEQIQMEAKFELPIPDQTVDWGTSTAGRIVGPAKYIEYFECSYFSEPFDIEPYVQNDILIFDLNGPDVEWRLDRAVPFFWRESINDDPASEGSRKYLRIQRGGFAMMNFTFPAGRDVKLKFTAQKEKGLNNGNFIEEFDVWIFNKGIWHLYQENLLAEPKVKYFEFQLSPQYADEVAVAFVAKWENYRDVDISSLVIE